MKKIIAFIISIVLVMTMTACGNTSNSPAGNTAQSTAPGTEESKSAETSKQDTNEELIYDSTKAFDYIEVDGGIAIIEFKNYDNVKYSKIIIPSQINNKDVIGIGSLEATDYIVFAYFPSSCEVVIPDTVSYIGGRAFQGASGLVKVSGGKNCKTIGEFAFMNCKNLTEITFLDNVTDLADSAFAGCDAWEATH